MTLITQHCELVLASGSAIRAQMLKAAGLNFSVVPSGVDEVAVSATLQGEPPETHAAVLAREKTLFVAKQYPDHITIGGDQICALEDRIYGKPGTAEKARDQLAEMAGKTHKQISGLCIARGEDILFESVECAELTMRTLTEAEIYAYIEADQPLKSCGSYKFESHGKHLFAQVIGDASVIKGMPLVQLLAFMHEGSYIRMGEAA